MTAISLSTRARLEPATARRGLALVLVLAAAVAWLVFRNQWTLPHNDDEPLFRSLNGVRDLVDANRTVLEPIRLTIGSIVDVFDLVIASLGWPGILGVAGALGWLFGGWRLALLGVTGFASLGTGETAAFLNDWTWDNGDPDNVTYSLFSAPRAETRLGYKNERVNELNTLAQEEADPAKRGEYYAEMQKLILDDAINVFLGYPSRAIGAIKSVQGLVLSPIGNIVLRDVDVA